VTGGPELVGEGAGGEPAQIVWPDGVERHLYAEPAPAQALRNLLLYQQEVGDRGELGALGADKQEFGVAEDSTAELVLQERPFVARKATGEHDRAEPVVIHLQAESGSFFTDDLLHLCPPVAASLGSGRVRRPRRARASS